MVALHNKPKLEFDNFLINNFLQSPKHKVWTSPDLVDS